MKWSFKRFRREKVNVEDISLILKAIRFAAHKHRNQRRSDKSASPYLNHPIAVADALWSVGGIHDINTITSAILHDTVEHTKTSLEELEAEFGKVIASIVREVTDEKRLWKQARRDGRGIYVHEGLEMHRHNNNMFDLGRAPEQNPTERTRLARGAMLPVLSAELGDNWEERLMKEFVEIDWT